VAESKSKNRSRKGSSASSSRRRTSGSGSSKSSSGNSGGGGSSSRRKSRSDRSAREVVMEAVDQVQGLIGRPVEAVTGMEKDGSTWTVTVEVVELSRIPNTTDVLGSYLVTLDRNGEITAARRMRRYYRSEAGED
jgi:hypothetical protein